MFQITADHFSLDQIYKSGQCFRMRRLPEGTYEVIAGDRYLRAVQSGNTVSFYCADRETDFWLDYFDLREDYGRYIRTVNPNDLYLCEAVRCSSGVRILRQDLWEMIVTFLVSQQNHIRRIRRCIDLLCENYGMYIAIPEESGSDGQKTEGYFSFPGPEAFADLREDALMGCNLGYRSKYVVRSAAQILSGEVRLDLIRKMTYKNARQELLKLYGVGEKVADCICLFARHDLDAFPIDTHIRQALDHHYKRGFPNRRYRGYRGVIQQYIFCYELWGQPAVQEE